MHNDNNLLEREKESFKTWILTIINNIKTPLKAAVVDFNLWPLGGNRNIPTTVGKELPFYTSTLSLIWSHVSGHFRNVQYLLDIFVDLFCYICSSPTPEGSDNLPKGINKVCYITGLFHIMNRNLTPKK